MRVSFSVLLIFITGGLLAQTPVNKTYPVTAGQKISFRFDYPELVKISTWDKNEILISGSVSINQGESDDAFELLSSNSGSLIYIENKIRNLKDLPKRITVTRGIEKLTFKSEADFKAYCKETGSDFNIKSWGVDMDILLEIKVPKNMETKLECVYGLAEVKSFSGPLSVEATYGGVDVSVQERTTGELTAETSYGQIYSNLDLKFTGSEFKDFHTVVSIKPGTGPKYNFESKYGNVYLRKSL
jgi:hypothetical protein